MIANYHTPVQIGFSGIIAQYQKALDALDLSDPDSLEKRIFYESVIRTLNAVNAFAHRYSTLALQMAEKEQDPFKLCCSFLKDLDDEEKAVLQDVIHTVQGVK